MILSPWRLVSWLLTLIVFGLPLAAAVLFVMAILGNPGTCEAEEQSIAHSPALATSFQEKWDRLNTVLAFGSEASITLSEAEVTSRAEQWVIERDVPVSDLVICFSMEGGAASGQVDVPFFPLDVDVLIRWTVDMTGETLKVEIEDIEVGGLPGPVADLVENFIDDLIDDQEEQLGLDFSYGVAFSDGEATISGQP